MAKRGERIVQDNLTNNFVLKFIRFQLLEADFFMV